MKYKIGENVIFIKKSSKEDYWKLNNYDVYTISCRSFNPYDTDTYNGNTNYYGVYNKNGESTWYDESDFIGLKEYRKIKLEKLKNI